MANNIIGFAGRARSGKSTLAQVLHNEEGYQILTIYGNSTIFYNR